MFVSHCAKCTHTHTRFGWKTKQRIKKTNEIKNQNENNQNNMNNGRNRMCKGK